MGFRIAVTEEDDYSRAALAEGGDRFVSGAWLSERKAIREVLRMRRRQRRHERKYHPSTLSKGGK